MASIQPIVGHLLSQYKETVLDGIQKMEAHLRHDAAAFANAFASDGQAMAALFRASQKGQDVLERCFGMARSLMLHCSPANRMVVARSLCSKDVFPSIRTALSTVSEAGLTHCLQSLALLSTVGLYCPKILLGRFGGYVPLHLPCFRLQLPFGLRRVRDARLAFLASLASSKYARTTRDVVCTHGFLTQLLEDAAEVMRQGDGTEASASVVKNVLDVVQHQYINSTTLDVTMKRSLLMGQRNILRILIKALTADPIADRVSEMLYQLIDVVVEPSCDYAVSRTEVEDKGMPNFLVFSILRLLRPKHTAREAALSCYILHKCPDLIRPYFVRLSGHLADDTGSVRGTTTSPVSNVAIFNVVTRALLAPLPYHLRANVARLQPTSEGTHRFFSLTPKNVAEEVCPSWLGEFVHKRINNSTNLVVLLWAIQVTQAALNRAMHAQQLIHAIHAASVAAASDRGTHRRDDGLLAVDLEQYDAEFMAALETFLPRREEFWHRMTQQLQKQSTEPLVPATAFAAEGAKLLAQRTQFVAERMMVLMDGYTSIFRLRVPWLSAAPSAAPRLDARTGMTTVAKLLCSNCDVLSSWEPKAISTLCLLLCSSLSRGVQMPKLHHINMGNAPSTVPKTQMVADWPALLSILQWFCRHKAKTEAEADALPDDTQEALGYVTRLALMCVHSVSVRYAAELNEVFLWLMELEEGLIPCFLHVLNLMLMRAMSKTAERIASSLMETEHGVLVECAKLLVAKTREKTAAAAAPATGGRGQTGNIWQQDLESNIGAFEKLIARIVEKWPKRQKLFRRGLARAAHAIAEHALHGRKQLEVAVLAVSNGTGTSAPLHEVVEVICFPTGNERDGVEAARALVPAVETDADAQWADAITATTTLAALGKLLTKGAMEWMRSPALAWTIVRHMTALEATAHAAPSADEAAAAQSTEHAMRFAVRVLKALVSDAPAVSLFLSAQQRDLHAGGLLLLVLGCLQMVLRHASIQRLAAAPLSKETLAALNKLIVGSYGGTLTTADRMRYAALLHLHYIQEAGDKPAAVNGAAPTVAEKDEEQSSEDDNASDDNEASGTKKPKRTHAHAGEGVLLASCVVPVGLRTARYVTEGIVATPNVTREVDVLTQLLDAWTDLDAQSIAGPIALSNGVYVRTSGTAMASTASSLSGLWRAVFPDILTTRDRHVVDVLAATSADAYDPRYLLPLVNTVAAIAQAKPELVPPHLLTRMFSLSLRALSFTCGTLRLLASNILALSSKCLTPLRRSLVNYARLCVVRIELAEARRGKVRDAADPIPRLPCSVTAFLHNAQNPIHRYEHHLHNNVVGFLTDTPACFSSQVPLHQLLNAFPLGCITHALMAKKQEEIVHGPNGAHHHAAGTASTTGVRHAPVHGRRGREADSVLNEGVQSFQAALQQDTPAHLDFALAMLVHCSGTSADARRLMRTGTLSSLMSLVAMLSSTPVLRLRVLRVLTHLCTATSADVASTYAVEGQVLSWTHFFAMYLTEELGADRDAFGGPLFCSVLSLMLRLLRALSGRSAARQLAISKASTDTLAHRLRDLCVSSKEVWDTVQAILKITGDVVA